jgi:hypothetical protein
MQAQMQQLGSIAVASDDATQTTQMLQRAR